MKFDCNWRFFIILEIELLKVLEDKVYRLFLDSIGKYFIICMEFIENLYLFRNFRKFRFIGKLKVKNSVIFFVIFFDIREVFFIFVVGCKKKISRGR